MKKRLTSVMTCLLAGILLLGATGCANAPETPTDIESVGTVSPTDDATAPETVDLSCVTDLDPDLRYDGETVSIILGNHLYAVDELVAEKLGNGTVSDAVYERNMALCDRFGIDMTYAVEDYSVSDKVSLDISGGTGAYDIAVNCTYLCVIPSMNGQYINLTPLDNLDLSKKYWTQGYNSIATYTTENKQFLASGSMAISMSRLMFFTIYNKTLLESMHKPDLFEVVQNSEWTLDYQNQLITDCYVDSDGDGQKTAGDTYGFVSGNWISVDPYVVAADIHLIGKDPDTCDLVFDKEACARLPELGDAVLALYTDASSYIFQTHDHDDADKFDIISMFSEGRVLTATSLFWHLEHTYNDLANTDYGVAPIPKLTREQTHYYSYVQDQVSSYGISAGVGDPARQEMLAAVLEQMAMLSYQTVTPAYYDTCLSYRYMQNPESKAVLDLMFDSIMLDFANTCGNIIVDCVMRDQLRSIFTSKGRGVASATASWERSVSRALKTYNRQLNKDTEK